MRVVMCNILSIHGLVAGSALLLATGLPAITLSAKVFLTVPQALERFMPAGAIVSSQTAYLTDAQLSAAKALAGRSTKIESAIVPYYVAKQVKQPIHYAYLDTHLVRTLPETVMIFIDDQDTINRIEVLSFREPPDYLPKERWFQQFSGKQLSPKLSLTGEIHGITGATLTSRAQLTAVRRILALHQVIHPSTNRNEP